MLVVVADGVDEVVIATHDQGVIVVLEGALSGGPVTATELDPKPKTQRNEPMHLAHIAAVIARCVEKPLTQLAQETTQVAEAFFGLDARPPSQENSADS